MENNEIKKFEGGLIKQVNNALGVTNKLLSINLRPLRISHLDDHILYAKGISNCILKKFPNATFKNIQDGDKALEYVINCFENIQLLDLIITDINHPGLNGIDFSKAVREKEKSLKKIPIIFITMIDTEDIIKDAETIPFIKYLSKCSWCEEINFAIDNFI